MKKEKKAKKGVGFLKMIEWQSRAASHGIVILLLGYLTIYCTDTLKMNPIVVGTLLAVSKVIDGITDLFAGFIVDRTHTKWGKGRPYEWCIVGMWLCTWLMFSASPEWSGVIKGIWIFSLMFVFPPIIRKFSKQKLIMAGVIITCVGLFINFIAGSNMTLLMIGALLQNAGAVPISMLASLLIVDCAEYNEWKGMRRMEGTLGSVNGFASKVGGSLGTAFVGIMIGLAGYDASAAVMPDSALLMIRLLYSLIPLALYVVVFIAMGFYKVEKDMPQILKDNEEKRAAYLAEHPETENK